MLTSWMTEFRETCADPALEAYDASTGTARSVARFFIWLGVALATEQVVHALTLALGARRLGVKVRVRPFRLPTGLALAWVSFTALSIVLTALTWRSNAAVLAKTLHVVTEALFLVYMLVAFGYRVVAGIVASLVLVAVLLVLTLPCSETILYAASSGLVLDAINFLVYAWHGLTLPNDSQLWLLIWGLGWHAMYLLTMVGVMRWRQLSGAAKVVWRVLGLYFNIVASEFFLEAVRREMRLAAGGKVELKRWSDEVASASLGVHAGDGEGDGEGDGADGARGLRAVPLCLWTSRGARPIGKLPSDERGVTVNAYAPGLTAYLPGAWPRALHGLFPLFGGDVKFTLRKNGTVAVEEALLCGYGWTKGYETEARDVASYAFVLSWRHVRGVYWTIALLLAVFIAVFP